MGSLLLPLSPHANGLLHTVSLQHNQESHDGAHKGNNHKQSKQETHVVNNGSNAFWLLTSSTHTHAHETMTVVVSVTTVIDTVTIVGAYSDDRSMYSGDSDNDMGERIVGPENGPAVLQNAADQLTAKPSSYRGSKDHESWGFVM